MYEFSFSKKIFPSIVGKENSEWQSKLDEAEKIGLTEAAVFLEYLDKKERDHLYKFLERSSIKYVPLVHLRHDTDKEDIVFFMEKFGTRHFNIHEEDFQNLERWDGYSKNLYLEMNFDNEVDKDVKVRRIGGFCVDLAHFKAAIARGAEESAYIHSYEDQIDFGCNHLSGYDSKNDKDIHTVTDPEQFDYLTTLPRFVFSDIIALEIDNPIREQLYFKSYISSLLDRYFNAE